MISATEAHARVTRGAAHLDRVRPGWFNRIDVGTLDLANCYHCTLGQLFGLFSSGVVTLGFRPPSGEWTARHKAVTHGFMLSHRDSDDNPIVESEAHGLLQDAWIAAIADRRLAATSTEVLASPEPVSA